MLHKRNFSVLVFFQLEFGGIIVHASIFVFILSIIATADKAKMFRDKFRSQQPIRYSARRRSDGSTPSVSPTPNGQNDRNGSNSQYPENLSYNEHENELSLNDSREVLLEDQHFINESQIAAEHTSMRPNEPVNQNSEVKDIMPNVEMGEEEFLAIENVFNDNCDDGSLSDAIDENSIHSENTVQQVPQIHLSPGERAFLDGGILKVTKKYPGCEITYTYGEKFAPKVPMFEVKLNDIISMNIPFKENVSFENKNSINDILLFFIFEKGNGDRAYLVQTKDDSKEVQLASRVVNGLKELNSGDKRANPVLDKAFIKILLVSWIGIQKIKDHGLDKDV